MSTDFAEWVKAEDDEADNLAKEAAKAQIKDLYEWKQTEKGIESALRELDPKARSGRYEVPSMGPLRRWLHDHLEEPRLEVEHEQNGEMVLYYARLISGGTETVVKNELLKKDHADVWAKLDELGLLVVDVKKLKGALDSGTLPYAAVAGYVEDEPKSKRLDVGVERGK